MFNLILILGLFYFFIVEVFTVPPIPKLPERVFYQLEDMDQLFVEFMHKYDKKYSFEELEMRRKVFEDNLMQINRWNREKPEAVFGINKFTDMTYAEFARSHTCVSGNLTKDNVINYKPIGDAPDSLDWRDSNLVTEVKDQQRCGACYIFSAIGNIEGQYAKKSGQLISLSEQQSLDCNSNGCNGGYPDQVMQGLVSSGCMRESDYPYVGQQGQCQTDQSKIVVKVQSGSQLSIGSEDDLKNALYNNGPLSIVVYTNEQWSRTQGGVLKPNDCNSNLHAVLLVGYGTDGSDDYWLIKNSWGQNWNENGYLRMVRGQGACGIGMYAASATVA